MGKEELFTTLIKQNEGVIFKRTTFYTDHRDDQKDHTKILYISCGNHSIPFSQKD